MAEGDNTSDLAKEFGISEDKVAEYREAFNIFDTDSSGTISLEELRQVMSNMGQQSADQQAEKIMAEADTNRNKTIEFVEFIRMMEKNCDSENQHLDIERAFKVFDKNGDGKINHMELKEAMKAMGQELSDEQIGLMISAADLDKDKEINLEEFKQMMA